jgi:DNA-binding response OmpR family regulator
MSSIFRHAPAAPIVIVEDDVNLIRLLRAVVSKEGYRPVSARDSHEAVSAITDERPALVVVGLRGNWLDRLALVTTLDRLPVLSRIPRLILGRGELADDRGARPASITRLSKMIRRSAARHVGRAPARRSLMTAGPAQSLS